MISSTPATATSTPPPSSIVASSRGGERVQELGAEILRLCREAGGSISGEHGMGNNKRCSMDWMFSPGDLAIMTLVRQAFDPAALANPGKLFPTPKTCAESARRRSEVPELAAVEVV